MALAFQLCHEQNMRDVTMRNRRYLSLGLSLTVVGTVLFLFDADFVREQLDRKKSRNAISSLASTERQPSNKGRKKTSTSTQAPLAPSSDRPIFFLHVGPLKTATSTCQRSFDANEEMLKGDKYTYLGMRLPTPTRDRFGVRTGLTAFRKFQSTAFLDKLGERIRRRRRQDRNFIVSSEDFARSLGFTDENGNDLFDLLKQVLKDFDLHAAIGYRRYYEWLASLYNQRHKNRNHRQSFVQWYRRGIMEKGSFAVWIEMQKYFDSISIINMHKSGDLMEHVYCDVLPNATNACTSYKKELASKETLANVNANPSVPLWPMAIAEEAISRGYTLSTRSSNSVMGRVRVAKRNINYMADRIAKFANEINYTLPLECLSQQEEEDVLELSLEHEKAIVPDFFSSPMGEVELQRSFEMFVKAKKLCSVNVSEVFQDELWLDFFGAMDTNLHQT